MQDSCSSVLNARLASGGVGGGGRGSNRRPAARLDWDTHRVAARGSGGSERSRAVQRWEAAAADRREAALGHCKAPPCEMDVGFTPKIYPRR